MTCTIKSIVESVERSTSQRGYGICNKPGGSSSNKTGAHFVNTVHLDQSRENSTYGDSSKVGIHCVFTFQESPLNYLFDSTASSAAEDSLNNAIHFHTFFLHKQSFLPCFLLHFLDFVDDAFFLRFFTLQLVVVAIDFFATLFIALPNLYRSLHFRLFGILFHFCHCFGYLRVSMLFFSLFVFVTAASKK